MARRTLLTSDTHREIVQAISSGAPFKDAAASVGVSERAFYDWLERGERYGTHLDKGGVANPGEAIFLAFREDVYEARSQNRVVLVNTIVQAALAGDWKAAAWLLERTEPAVWGRYTRTALELHADSTTAAALFSGNELEAAQAAIAHLDELSAARRRKRPVAVEPASNGDG